MRKILASLFLSIFVLTIYANTNPITNFQKLWAVNSEVYKNMNLLYLSYGLSLPSSSGPWNTEELIMMLDKIDINLCNELQQTIYNKIHDELFKSAKNNPAKSLGFSVGARINLESYIHTNPTDFYEEEDWNIGFTERKPFIVVPFEGWVANYFYGYGEASVGNSSGILSNTEIDSQYCNIFTTNIPGVFSNGVDDIDVNFPRRSLLSFGGNNWNISLGRDVIRWGHGETGNLFLGGNQIYDNHLRVTTFYEMFKFSCISIFYPHSQVLSNTSQNLNYNGLKMLLAHKYEGRFFNNRLSLSLQESMIYQSADNTLDIRIFNPLGIFHNYYIRGNSNSLLGIDADYAITKGLNIYGQFVMDELTVGKGDKGSNGSYRPSKLGYLLGIKYAYPTEKGVFTFSLEGVYTDPYLYLREKYNSTSETEGVSFYGDYREFNTMYGVTYLRKCIGYQYGGDAIVADLNFGYQSLSNWQSKLSFFYMAHGIIYNELLVDLLSATDINPTTPSTEDPTGSNESGEVEHLFRASLSGSYKVLSWFYTDAQIDNWFIVNKNNIDAPLTYDMQIYIGFHFEF